MNPRLPKPLLFLALLMLLGTASCVMKTLFVVYNNSDDRINLSGLGESVAPRSLSEDFTVVDDSFEGLCSANYTWGVSPNILDQIPKDYFLKIPGRLYGKAVFQLEPDGRIFIIRPEQLGNMPHMPVDTRDLPQPSPFPLVGQPGGCPARK